jgi:metal-responsive CopG/Arc/MetJ family transcriptional regulator
MVSFPDDLLGRLDEQARRRGTTRSGLLRELVERELSAGADTRRMEIARILAHAAPHGGRNAEHVRELRTSR